MPCGWHWLSKLHASHLQDFCLPGPPFEYRWLYGLRCCSEAGLQEASAKALHLYASSPKGPEAPSPSKATDIPSQTLRISMSAWKEFGAD